MLTRSMLVFNFSISSFFIKNFTIFGEIWSKFDLFPCLFHVQTVNVKPLQSFSHEMLSRVECPGHPSGLMPLAPNLPNNVPYNVIFNYAHISK